MHISISSLHASSEPGKLCLMFARNHCTAAAFALASRRSSDRALATSLAPA